jgi:hypothetical protein
MRWKEVPVQPSASQRRSRPAADVAAAAAATVAATAAAQPPAALPRRKFLTCFQGANAD